MDTKVILSARLGWIYEQKEAARRNKDWDERGVLTHEIPALDLKLIE